MGFLVVTERVYLQCITICHRGILHSLLFLNQAIQTSAARLIKVKMKSVEIRQILYDLHWLPIKERIVFKLLFVYKILNIVFDPFNNLLICMYTAGLAYDPPIPICFYLEKSYECYK